MKFEVLTLKGLYLKQFLSQINKSILSQLFRLILYFFIFIDLDDLLFLISNNLIHMVILLQENL